MECRPAQVTLAELVHSRDSAEASRLTRLAAEQNYPMAQYSLGLMYEKGDGVPADPDEARRWYRKSAALGNTDAMAKLK